MTPKERAAMQQALEALIEANVVAERYQNADKREEAITALREALAEPQVDWQEEALRLGGLNAKHVGELRKLKAEPVNTRSCSEYSEVKQEPNMKDAIIAGNEVLLNEQAWLLRECRGALDSLIKQRPNMAGLLCGSTTLGNLRAELGAYRPSGVMNGTK